MMLDSLAVLLAFDRERKRGVETGRARTRPPRLSAECQISGKEL